MNFAPCALSFGNRSLTSSGRGGVFRLLSMAGNRTMRLCDDTYRSPLRQATPIGAFRPAAMRTGLPAFMVATSKGTAVTCPERDPT